MNQKTTWLIKRGVLLLFLILVINIAMIYWKSPAKAPGSPVNDNQEVKQSDTSPAASQTAAISQPDNTTPASPVDKPKPEPSLPEKVLIKVPFTVQAPFANWDPLHEDACEEASLIMLKHFLNDSNIPSENDADKEIHDLVNFEEQNGYGPSITLENLNAIAQNYYNLNAGLVKRDVSSATIKQELASNHPVIIPAAGKVLPNPNFRNGGPNYHMLVVIGYDSDEFITNDPGTRKGQYFRYKYNDLINAIHDWDTNNILDGNKAYLVFDQ